MEKVIAKPTMLKQANLSQIRRVLAEKENATRAEIEKETDISQTTIRVLLKEMQQNGEIESIGYDESSGGRKAERYALCQSRYLGAVFCCMNQIIYALLINLCGEILEKTEVLVEDQNYEMSIDLYLEKLTQQYEIKVIGVGIPGVVDGGSYWKAKLDYNTLERVDIGIHLCEKHGIPILLENDINAITIGFGRCYEKKYPVVKSSRTNMAYLHFESDCISGGFLLRGRIIRGHRLFAGELGLIPMEDGTLLSDFVATKMDDSRYISFVVYVLGWICGLLNPDILRWAGQH